jgi:magnesium-transporting ATPase (P-type)
MKETINKFKGLTKEEVKAAQEKYGLNQITPNKRKPFYLKNTKYI